MGLVAKVESSNDSQINLQNERAPNVMAMVKSFNQLALLVPTEILEETTPQGRAKVISKYIKVRERGRGRRKR